MSIDDELSALAIRHALQRHGHYFETIDANDGARVEQLERLRQVITSELGVEVAMVARPRRLGSGLHVCISVTTHALTPETA